MNKIDPKAILASEELIKELNIPKGSNIEYSLLGAGEYNINYLFAHPESGEKLVLRIPAGSQLKLPNQAAYEYNALKMLAPTNRTPKPVYLNPSNTFAPYGFLIMEYLPGKALRYENDMETAAKLLAEIHNFPVPENNDLIRPDNPIEAILDECKRMADVFFDCDNADKDTKLLIRELLESGRDIITKGSDYGSRCIVNTELNSGNFLINGKDKDNFLVDWEKPLFAYAGQDLGHFLAPTTTFWKTDIILAGNDIYSFIQEYCKFSEHCIDPARLWESTLPYFTITCLRGITWCAMAWVEYQSPDRPIKNNDTYNKIQTYLTHSFLSLIRNEYIYG